ncbi:EamA family transporter [Neorhodopirellula pilleata]|uniref:EamA-like transporter family protein n=1 Tax=Neorhodopirellula pilleata TaxID=2714738 RepID=A0A5C6AXA9_9BACT|nr:EamA family transporter [Neorhodopirellula pilleata]TWU04111.1 EamA-like transporter family protein [Neorhodopirellula pilleata]
MNLWQSLSTSWQFWAFLSALAAALTAVFAKQGVKGIPPDVATFVRTVVILLFVSVMLYLSSQFGVLKSLSRRAIAFLVLSGLATGASWICYFRALDLGKAAQVASVDKLSVVLVAIIAMIFLKERLSPISLTGIGLITLGTVLVASGK